MTLKTIAAMILAAGVATSATAATSGAAAPSAVATGPAIPGMCVLSNDYVIGMSAVGKFVINRFGQLRAQVDAELNSEGGSLQNDAKALEAQRTSLSADQYDQKMGALQVRGRDLQRKADLRQRELQATQEKALGTISQQAEPIIRQLVTERNCSILLNGSAVVVASPAMDISPMVVQRLDAKIQQFAFDREHLDTQAGPAAQ
jgi:Skp family chaperone for outer membrane proteins